MFPSAKGLYGRKSAVTDSTAKYFEDFEAGERFTTGGRTVTEFDVMTFVTLTGTSKT